MAEVRPLRALRYSPHKVDDLAQVITPPYDIINHEAQAKYYARHPYNMIRLELALQKPTDDALDNVYTRAAATLAEWRLQGILSQETVACYYAYQQKFVHGGKTYTRTSLIARVRLEPWSARVVLPHENTMAKAKEDRLQLLRSCVANLSPILSLYNDPQGRIRRLLSTYTSQSEVQITDEDGEVHSLQPITDAQHTALIQDFFAPRQLYIADGHHRYTTALNYREEICEQRRGLQPDDAVNFVMMALIDIDDPGMLVLPTHRLLFGLSQAMLDQLVPQQLSRFFTVQSLENGTSSEVLLRQLEEAGQQQPSLLLHKPEQTLLLSLNPQGQHYMEESGRSQAWNQLDVSLTQRLILEAILGLNDKDMDAARYVRYLHDEQQTFQSVQSGEAQAAILLNRTPLRQVCDVAQADDRMPQKSTYIYPKLVTGLVMNPLW